MKNSENLKWIPTEDIINLFMAIFLCVVLFSSCGNRADEKIHYIKEKCIILDKGGYAERNGKHTNVGKYFLIRRISDTTEYTELTGYNWEELSDFYGSKLYYSKNIGDTLFFEYILKDRFWKKTNKINS